VAADFASPPELRLPLGLFRRGTGAGALSGGGFLSLIEINSTSKTRVALGPIGHPVYRGPVSQVSWDYQLPLGSDGHQLQASVQPLMTPVTGTLPALLRVCKELSN